MLILLARLSHRASCGCALVGAKDNALRLVDLTTEKESSSGFSILHLSILSHASANLVYDVGFAHQVVKLEV